MVATPIARVHFDDDFGLIFVTALVAGSPRAFLLDSAADHTLIDRRIADELQLDASNVQMFIGPVPFQPHDVVVSTQVQALESSVGRKVDGILGHELLERYVVTIDYAAQELAFYEPEHAPTGGDAIRVHIAERAAFVDVVLHDRAKAVAATLKLDTGSMEAVGLTSEFMATHHLFDGMPKVGFLAKLSAIKVGAITVGPLVIGWKDDATEHTYAGTLGAGLLQQFTVTFDYPHHRLLLEGRERPPALAVDGSGLSIATFADDLKRCEVVAVVAGSPAAASGIVAGDEIVAISNVPFAEVGLAALWSLLRQPGTLRLTLRRAGADRVVAIALRPLL